jgi:hypothetical protein
MAEPAISGPRGDRALPQFCNLRPFQIHADNRAGHDRFHTVGKPNRCASKFRADFDDNPRLSVKNNFLYHPKIEYVFPSGDTVKHNRFA